MKPQTLFVVAGESSGDVLGASILRALKHKIPDLPIIGIGGPQMEAAGHFTSLLPFHHLSVMGIWQVLRRLPHFWSLLNHTKQAMTQCAPTALLTIDFPGFCLRLSRWAGKAFPDMPRIHCVAPSVWAWRPGRANHMARDTDHLLSLFPFEPPLFPMVPCHFVGHPVMEQPLGDPQRFKTKYPHLAQGPFLCVLPGSREQEIRAFLPTFIQAFQHLKLQIPTLQGGIVTPPFFRPYIHTLNLPISLIEPEDKWDAFASARAALAASGTVTLELARQGTPMVVGYKVSKPTEWIMRRLLKISSISLVNILAMEACVPECLQKNFTPAVLAGHLLPLLQNDAFHEAHRKKLALCLQGLEGASSFGPNAAQIITSIVASF